RLGHVRRDDRRSGRRAPDRDVHGRRPRVGRRADQLAPHRAHQRRPAGDLTMATYGDLAQDLRALVPDVTEDGPRCVPGKSLARLLHRTAVALLTECVDLAADDQRIPRSTSSLTVPGDLTDGFDLPSGVIKPEFVAVEYSTGNVRALVTLVPASKRFAL